MMENLRKVRSDLVDKEMLEQVYSYLEKQKPMVDQLSQQIAALKKDLWLSKRINLIWSQ